MFGVVLLELLLGVVGGGKNDLEVLPLRLEDKKGKRKWTDGRKASSFNIKC